MRDTLTERVVIHPVVVTAFLGSEDGHGKRGPGGLAASLAPDPSGRPREPGVVGVVVGADAAEQAALPRLRSAAVAALASPSAADGEVIAGFAPNRRRAPELVVLVSASDVAAGAPSWAPVVSAVAREFAAVCLWLLDWPPPSATDAPPRAEDDVARDVLAWASPLGPNVSVFAVGSVGDDAATTSCARALLLDRARRLSYPGLRSGEMLLHSHGAFVRAWVEGTALEGDAMSRALAREEVGPALHAWLGRADTGLLLAAPPAARTLLDRFVEQDFKEVQFSLEAPIARGREDVDPSGPSVRLGTAGLRVRASPRTGAGREDLDGFDRRRLAPRLRYLDAEFSGTVLPRLQETLGVAADQEAAKWSTELRQDLRDHLVGGASLPTLRAAVGRRIAELDRALVGNAPFLPEEDRFEDALGRLETAVAAVPDGEKLLLRTAGRVVFLVLVAAALLVVLRPLAFALFALALVECVRVAVAWVLAHRRLAKSYVAACAVLRDRLAAVSVQTFAGAHDRMVRGVRDELDRLGGRLDEMRSAVASLRAGVTESRAFLASPGSRWSLVLPEGVRTRFRPTATGALLDATQPAELRDVARTALRRLSRLVLTRGRIRVAPPIERMLVSHVQGEPLGLHEDAWPEALASVLDLADRADADLADALRTGRGRRARVAPLQVAAGLGPLQGTEEVPTAGPWAYVLTMLSIDGAETSQMPSTADLVEFQDTHQEDAAADSAALPEPAAGPSESPNAPSLPDVVPAPPSSLAGDPQQTAPLAGA